ncbi:MAG: ATP-dependent helicase, partial [Bacteroidales bacterium]|nr:ATP-dependent helicase [Bacteroidales bacterium]
DMGFYDDIMKIIAYLPEKRQNLLFAATMPPKIKKLAEKVLSNPVEVNIALSKPAEKVLQVAYVVTDRQKIPLVNYLLQGKQLRSILVFCSTKSKTKQLSAELRKHGLSADEIHSDLEQPVREKVLNDFKNRKTSILVATDILSRGIDVEDIDLVVNFDVPGDFEDYIHRIGRTARAEADGVAITLIGESEQSKFASIENGLGKTVMKLRLPRQLGESPEYNPRRSFHRDKGKRPGKRKR